MSWRGVGYGVAGSVGVVLLVVGLAWVFQRRLIYLPSGGEVPAAGTVITGARDVEYTAGDGVRLRGWFVPAGGSDTGVTVLVAPGNAGNRMGRAPLAEGLRARGMSVLLAEYRGYGGNPGDPTEGGLALDIRAARDFVINEIKATRVIYFGESLGAAVVTGLAVEHAPAGMVLRSPFVDLAAVGAEHYPFLPVRALLRDRFAVAEAIPKVKAPTTVVLGTADDVVPAEQSRAVARAAGGAVRTVELAGANHNDPRLAHGREVIDAVAELARKVG